MKTTRKVETLIAVYQQPKITRDYAIISAIYLLEILICEWTLSVVSCKLYRRDRLLRQNYKELSSRPVDVSCPGQDALSLSLLKITGTTANNNEKQRIFLSIFSHLLPLQT